MTGTDKTQTSVEELPASASAEASLGVQTVPAAAAEVAAPSSDEESSEVAAPNEAATEATSEAAPRKKRRRKRRKPAAGPSAEGATEGPAEPASGDATVRKAGPAGKSHPKKPKKEAPLARPIAGSWFDMKPQLSEEAKAETIASLAQKFKIEKGIAKSVFNFLDADYTIPFIARFRRDQVGGMAESRLRKMRDAIADMAKLQERRQEAMGYLSDDDRDAASLLNLLRSTSDAALIDDIAHIAKARKKARVSKAQRARELGLEVLADRIAAQADSQGEATDIASAFVREGVSSPEEALDGAKAILVDRLFFDPTMRAELRQAILNRGILVANARGGKEKPDSKFKAFYTYREAVRRVPPHRLLAVERGVRERALDVHIEPPADSAATLEAHVIRQPSVFSALLKEVVAEVLLRLTPVIAKDIRRRLHEDAEDRSIETFSSNLRHLLLQPPTREKVVAGIDPGAKNNIRLAAVDAHGAFIGSRSLHPFEPKGDPENAAKQFLNFIEDYRVEIVAVGNGSSSRQADRFLASVLKQSPEAKVRRAVVNESGAVVYATSDLAKEELPTADVSTRAAVSIARRLQDPLMEFVKIEPKFLGVGQYQHDVNQKKLSQALYEEVLSVVHQVGVDLNRATKALLLHISGIDAQLADNILKFRTEKGRFERRSDLMEVDRLGPKAYEQISGFVRVVDGKEALDNTDIHPECYRIVEQMCVSIGRTVRQVMDDPTEVSRIEPDRFYSERFGPVTVGNILESLRRPKQDPRDSVEPMLFREDVVELEDLNEGMILEGTVTNVTDFGAFVDIGVHQDGLIHISEIADGFVKHPSEVIHVGDRVRAKVISVDKTHRRIGLSLRQLKDSTVNRPEASGDRGAPRDRGPRRPGSPAGAGQDRGARGQAAPARGPAGPGKRSPSESGPRSDAPRGDRPPRRDSPSGPRGERQDRGDRSERKGGPRRPQAETRESEAPPPSTMGRGVRLGDLVKFSQAPKPEAEA